MRPGLLALVLCGCFGKPAEPLRADAAGSADVDATGPTADSSHCEAAFTGSPRALPGASGQAFADPAITNGLLDLYFSREANPGTGDYHIAHGHRADLQSAVFMFDAVPMPFFSGASIETDPAPSADGNKIAFVRKEQPGLESYGWLATRNGNSWDVVRMPNIEDRPMTAVDLSPDAKTVYWTDVDGLHAADYDQGAYIDRFQIYGTSINFPAVSGDGLEVYYNDTGGIFWRGRPTGTAPFGPALPVIDASDPDLSADGQTLVFVAGSSVAYLTRSCPTQ